MGFLNKLLSKGGKPVTIEYAKEFLRSKGIATSDCIENNVTFKLYEMNWNMYIEDGRFGLRNSFKLWSDINMECLMSSINKLNSERWIVKAFIEKNISDEHVENIEHEGLSTSIVFSFENFCYSRLAFEQIYEFAIYAMSDGVDFHRKCYSQKLAEYSRRTQESSSPIGFHTTDVKSKNVSAAVEQHSRRKIGLV